MLDLVLVYTRSTELLCLAIELGLSVYMCTVFCRSQQSDEKCNPLPNFKCSTYQNQSLSPDPGTKSVNILYRSSFA